MERIILSNHTVGPGQEGAAVGRLKAVGAVPGSVSFHLAHDASGKFEISDHLLKLKNDQVTAVGESPFYYDISITARGNGQMLTEAFCIVKDDFLTNGVVAHRGAHKHGAGSANSMTAFKDAIKMATAAFECDVLLSSDQRVVVAHGPGSGHDGGKPDMPVHSSTWEQLSRVYLGNGDYLPLLEEVLCEVKRQNRTGVVIELKETADGHDLLLAGRVFDIVKDLQAQAWVFYISSKYEQLLEILKRDEFARCSPLENCRADVSAYAADGMWGVDFRRNKYNKRLVQECRQAGLKVNTWTVNKPRKMKKFKEWGMDFVTTDEPEKCLKIWHV